MEQLEQNRTKDQKLQTLTNKFISETNINGFMLNVTD